MPNETTAQLHHKENTLYVWKSVNYRNVVKKTCTVTITVVVFSLLHFSSCHFCMYGSWLATAVQADHLNDEEHNLALAVALKWW